MNGSSISKNADEVLARLQRGEAIYRQAMQDRGVPPQLHDGLVRYLVHRIRPGHFLVATLASDLSEALGRADQDCQRGLGSIFLFLWQVAPCVSWGSYEALESWLDKGDERNADTNLGAVVEHDTQAGEQ